MIRANLNAGGSLVTSGSNVTSSSSSSMNFALPSDTTFALVTATSLDTYGSNLVILLDLSDTSNPLYYQDTGSWGTLSAITYSSNTLNITFSGVPSGETVTVVPLKVA